MSTPITSMPPSTATAVADPTVHPDYYDTIPAVGCGCISGGCYVSQRYYYDS